MRSKIFVYVLCILAIFIIAGCGNAENEEEYLNRYQFLTITEVKPMCEGNGVYCSLIYDKDTKTVYYECGGHYRFSLTPYIKNGHYTFFNEETQTIEECL